MVAKQAQEQAQDITFNVRIRMFGKPRHVDDAGETLAKLCGLNFNDATVTRGNTTYRHETQKRVDGQVSSL